MLDDVVEYSTEGSVRVHDLDAAEQRWQHDPRDHTGNPHGGAR